jgi:zinc transporter ZupT
LFLPKGTAILIPLFMKKYSASETLYVNVLGSESGMTTSMK